MAGNDKEDSKYFTLHAFTTENNNNLQHYEENSNRYLEMGFDRQISK